MPESRPPTIKDPGLKRFKFLFRDRLVEDPILRIRKVGREKTMLAVLELIRKVTILAFFGFLKVHTFVAGLDIHALVTKRGVDDQQAVHQIMISDSPIAIVNIFIF